MATNQKRLLEYGLEYVSKGYYVFPLTVSYDEEKGKKRLTIPFPRAEGWNEESTVDPEKVREWFATPRRGMKGIAIDCGKSGVVAIDLDTGEGKNGLEEWEKLPEQQETPMMVRTRSGGLHRLYRDPTGRVRNSAGDVAPGIDIRGNGGLVIAPPTRVWGSEGVYTLVNEIVPVTDLPELSPGMVEIIATRQETERPKFDPAIHGSYKVSATQGEEIVAERLARLESGRGMRAGIFGYAVGVAQLEGAKAATSRDGAEPDPDALAEHIGEQVLSVVDWDVLDDEDRQWIADGVTKGLAHPWELVPEEDVLPAVDPDTPLDDLLLRKAPRLPGHPSTAHALCAPVVVDGLVGRYLYVDGIGWHEWVGDRWSPDPRTPVRHAVRRMIARNRAEARRMVDALKDNEEAQQLEEELVALKEDRGSGPVGQRERELQKRADEVNEWREEWDRAAGWWYALANGRDHDLVMRYVEADPGRIYVRASDLDADPHLLNTPSGTVDLRTAEIRRHDPADYITKTTHVPYVPGAHHDLWNRARESFAPGVEEWLQLKAGEGAYGFPTNDDTMMFCFGGGSNGKSTLTDALLNGLGDYAVFLHDKAVLGGKDDHGTEKMVFRGARWAVLEELPEAQVLRPATIKKLVGTSKITARLMRQNNVTFDASHSIVVNANHRPQVLENDRGTWRRLIAVPWPYTYKFEGEPLEDETERRADPVVKHALSRDIEVQKAALAWIVEGARLYWERGQKCGALPESVARETESWRLESDVFGSFFAQEMEAKRGYAVSSAELLEVYNEHLESLGKQPVSDQYVATRLATLPGCRNVRKKLTRRNEKAVTVSSRGPVTSLPTRFTAWVGLRWLTEEEKAAEPKA
ncbi:phage/plasmid primase, P4 family [Prauserella muralis]|uniref:Uncharacterized protein n=1 Tax=Prauserella muralis TaxID=588067 RepID=A0A2V4AY54_9PSEU|nr:phage/plasmid primase, P4 family [Prauserella muralis]PXY20860.1 hypothetical protein BAY60_25485 [Prauserella muralis]TWE29900.1 P4 family phage/plasmid primase-like protein [Prauserella muralis]